jgi:heme-degrading monooxygenase HmoA
MITRIVKLAIAPGSEQGTEFERIFASSKAKIAAQPGCFGVKMLRGEGHYFTYSTWNAEADLNQYRKSELFREVWPRTKALFYNKPEAWTLEELAEATA